MNWKSIIAKLEAALEEVPLPSVSEIAEEKRDPFRVLISTVISLRTKDEVTLAASNRLFDEADTPETLIRLSEERIEKLIYPAGFYKTKARSLKRIASLLIEKYNGRVPDSQEELLKLPGVGRKTANLVLNLGFGKKAICVDTHVHRIPNRLGWICTRTPEETEFALMEILPDRYWIGINELLVKFGQQICRPVAPFCSRCPIRTGCQKVGVGKSR